MDFKDLKHVLTLNILKITSIISYRKIEICHLIKKIIPTLIIILVYLIKLIF